MRGRVAELTVWVMFLVEEELAFGLIFFGKQQRVCLFIDFSCRIQLAAIEQYVGQRIQGVAEIANVPFTTGYIYIAAGMAFRCRQVAALLIDVGGYFQGLKAVGLAYKPRLQRRLGGLQLLSAEQQPRLASQLLGRKLGTELVPGVE